METPDPFHVSYKHTWMVPEADGNCYSHFYCNVRSLLLFLTRFNQFSAE